MIPLSQRIWTRQPQILVGPDPSQPFFKYLTNFSVPLGTTMYDFVSRKFWTSSYGSPGHNHVYSGMHGRAMWSYDGGILDDWVYSPQAEPNLFATDRGTVLAVFNKEDSTDRSSEPFCLENNSAGERIQAHIPYSDGVTYVDFGGTSGSNRISVSGLSGEYQRGAAIMIAGGYAGLYFAVNGRIAADSTTAVTRTAGTDRYRLGANDNDKFYFFAAWREQIPRELAMEWTANPWQLFAPALSRRIYLMAPQAGGGNSYTITAAQGSIDIGGIAASPLLGRVATATEGSYAINGINATLELGRVLTAAEGSYAINGIDATLTYQQSGRKSIVADVGSYAITGIDATLAVGRVITAAQGSYAITGFDATTARNRAMAAVEQSFAITGIADNLLLSRVIAASEGTYSITGIDPTLTKSAPQARTIAADIGGFTIEGFDAALILPAASDQPRGGTSKRDVRLAKRKRPRYWWEEEEKPDLVIDEGEPLAPVKTPDVVMPATPFSASDPLPKADVDLAPIVSAMRKRGRMKLAAVIALQMFDE